MRKFYSLVLIAAGLLIGTNLWAQNVCKIGDVGYPTLQDAFDLVLTNDVPTTIEMIADIDIKAEDNWTAECLAKVKANQNIVLELNGHNIDVVSMRDKANYVFIIEKNGKLTIQDKLYVKENIKPAQVVDGHLTEDPAMLFMNGRITYKDNEKGKDGSTIINHGTLNIKNGIFKNLTDSTYAEGHGSGANYCIDNYAKNEQPAVPAVCTIEDGYFFSSMECVRNYNTNANYVSNLSIIGGVFGGMKGVFFVMNGKDGGNQNVTISNGTFMSGNNALVRLYTDGYVAGLSNTNISISGGTANVGALMIHHVSFASGHYDELRQEMLSNYPSIFDITGGTYASENYYVKCNGVYYAKDENGNNVLVPREDGQQSVTPSTLPTLIDGALYRDSLHSQSNDDGTITVVPLTKINLQPTDGVYINLKEPTSGLTVKDNDVDFIGIDSVYSLVVENADAIVKNGAILNVGPGGVQAINGGRIIVEAGGILKVGEYGFEGSGADALVVYSDTEHSGVVAISPMAYLHETPALTIKMKTRAYTSPEDDSQFAWQYFAIPTSGACNLSWKTQADAPYMYRWDAPTQNWVGISSVSELNKPFVGYILTTDNTTTGTEYTMNGNLVGRENAQIIMVGDGTDAFSLLGNSYLAPIDLKAMFAGIKATGEDEGIMLQATIYNAESKIFETVTKAQADEPDDDVPYLSIPPMNAFYMALFNAQTTAGFTINYANAVWGKENVLPMRTPIRGKSQKTALKISVEGNGQQDVMRLYESNEFTADFDNGADGLKMMNNHVNLYSVNDSRNLCHVATNDLNGTQLNFQAGDDVEYTMTFSNRNNDNFVLVDHLTNAQVAMTDGATYTFVATPNETTENRFEIRKAGGVVTNLAEMKAAHAVKGIYTAAGQYVGKADRWNTLPAGMYIVDGVKMAK